MPWTAGCVQRHRSDDGHFVLGTDAGLAAAAFATKVDLVEGAVQPMLRVALRHGRQDLVV
jgi:hypothetical protein